MKLKKGDKVVIDGHSGFTSPSTVTITKVTTKYNENTGKPYKVYWAGSHGFHEKGHAITTPTAYYIVKKVK